MKLRLITWFVSASIFLQACAAITPCKTEVDGMGNFFTNDERITCQVKALKDEDTAKSITNDDYLLYGVALGLLILYELWKQQENK